jgi:peptidyl-dipeptidase A
MKSMLFSSAAVLVLMSAGCQSVSDVATPSAPSIAPAQAAAPAAPTPAEASAYLRDAEAKLKAFREYASKIAWVQATNITDDTNWLMARASAEGTELSVQLANGTKRFQGVPLSPSDTRKMQRLLSGITLPAPSTPGAAEELAQITTRLSSTYSTGKFAYKGKSLNLDELSTLIETSRNPAELKTVWEGWHTISPPMAKDYARMVEIANAGARELGFGNLAEMWLSNYDMPAADMEKEADRLWTQVEPLYRELHCNVRHKLSLKYGSSVQPDAGPIRADLLGNMWAQQWSTIYPIAGPKTSGPGYDLTQRLVAKTYTPEKMARTGEAFFSSLGFAPLPETFWTRSMITRPRDREVVCHASAWNLDDVEDIRIKMCTEVNAEDFVTVHHELGHNYYQRAYNQQDYLFRDGAHDGFHEAIGDFVALSITPEYLKQIGLIDRVPPASADIGLLYDRALEKIAFLPFGLLMDKWRWQVFRGETAPADYNKAWWELRTKYQGIAPPGPRPADAFDPGAKFHIPDNTPYLRYFLSFVMQFQFHKAACEQAGWKGPLHRCSIYGNKEVGAKFNAMLEKGNSQPWPDTLELFTGTRQMSAEPMVEYFAPLMTHLKKENQGLKCGW